MNKTLNEHFLSLIIPAYKQEKTIAADVKAILNVLITVKYDYEVIVVIDGRIDQSARILKKQIKNSKVKLITYEKNQGKSFAIRLGMQEARGDYVMFMDAGMEISPRGISMLIEHMDWYEADIVVGSKRHPASKVNYPLRRRIYSQGYYYLTRILFNLKIRDTQAGIKLFNKKTLETILPLLIEKKFAGDLEILAVAQRKGFTTICEAPIELTYSSNDFSTAIKPSSVVGILLDTLAIFYRAKIIRYYDRSVPPHIKFNYQVESLA